MFNGCGDSSSKVKVVSQFCTGLIIFLLLAFIGRIQLNTDKRHLNEVCRQRLSFEPDFYRESFSEVSLGVNWC